MNGSELTHSLFFREIDQLEQTLEALWQIHQGDAFTAAKNAWLHEQIPSREAFLARMEDYAQHGKPDNLVIRQTHESIQNALEYTSKASGKKQIAMFRNSGWAIHLGDYAAAVHASGNQTILELAAGAGLGTYAVLNHLPAQSKLISMDFDFICTQNAIGIAKALGVEDRTAALCANHWHMPFEDGVLSTVCTHYGLDETREVPTVLTEIARVLRPGGRFVLVTRMDALVRRGSWFEMFDVGADEALSLMHKLRLTSTPEALIEAAAACGLVLTSRKNYTPEDGHHRILMAFEKTS